MTNTKHNTYRFYRQAYGWTAAKAWAEACKVWWNPEWNGGR